jgi:Fic family protein
MTYLWQKPEWPSFNWSSSALLDVLVKARFEQGRLLSLPTSFVHSFEISDSKKSLYQDLLLDKLPFSIERLHGWQASLFPTGYSGVKKIKIAEFRNKDLLRSSHPKANLQEEFEKYLHWWIEPPVELDPVLRSAVAFFWFYIISPYEDGNFELASALSELALQEQEKLSLRPYDISIQLEENTELVAQKIENCISGSGNITEWLLLYLDLYITAVRSALTIADKNNAADLFWKKNSSFDLNQRQRKILNHLLDMNVEMTNREYVEICKTSRESAKRDLAELVRLGLLKLSNKKGRSVSYFIFTA